VHVSSKFYVTFSFTFYAYQSSGFKIILLHQILRFIYFLRMCKTYRRCMTFFDLVNMYRLLCLRHSVRHIGIHIRCWLFFPVFRKGGIMKQFLVEVLYVIF
jgi:hypothetical protein